MTNNSTESNSIDLTEANVAENAQLETHALKHENTIYAEPVFNIGSFQVTNSLLVSWIVVAIILVLCLTLGKKIKKIPGKLQGFFEFIVDGALNIMDSVTNDRDKTMKYFPLVFGLFVFVLLNNWLGVLPGVGSIGYVAAHNGESVFVPYLRGGTADINTTLALALMSLLIVHVSGVIAVGAWNYLNKFINIKTLLEIPKKVKKDPSVLIVNPIMVFVGLLEIVSELAKVISLSFRLFGNVFAGEVLLFTMASILAFLLPVPFLFLEIFVGVIQALIFSILTLVFLVMATSKEAH